MGTVWAILKPHVNSSGLTEEDHETFALVSEALVETNTKIDCSDFVKNDSTDEEVTICLKSFPNNMEASVVQLVETKQTAHENAADHLESLKS